MSKQSGSGVRYYGCIYKGLMTKGVLISTYILDKKFQNLFGGALMGLMMGGLMSTKRIIKMHPKVFKLIEDELESAKIRYPWWPSDAVHAGAIVAEEAGELTQATLDHVYDHLNHNGADTVARMQKEAVQTAAMAVRFLENMDAYTDPGRRMKAEPISRAAAHMLSMMNDSPLNKWPWVKEDQSSHAEMVDYIRGDTRDVDDDLK